MRAVIQAVAQQQGGDCRPFVFAWISASTVPENVSPGTRRNRRHSWATVAEGESGTLEQRLWDECVNGTGYNLEQSKLAREAKLVCLVAAQRFEAFVGFAMEDARRDMDIAAWCEGRVRGSPNALAVVAACESLGCAELDRGTDCLAHQLNGFGVRLETLVALCSDPVDVAHAGRSNRDLEDWRGVPSLGYGLPEFVDPSNLAFADATAGGLTQLIDAALVELMALTFKDEALSRLAETAS